MMLLSAWRARSRPLRVGFVELEAWHNEEGIAVEPRRGRLVLDANLDHDSARIRYGYHPGDRPKGHDRAPLVLSGPPVRPCDSLSFGGTAHESIIVVFVRCLESCTCRR